MIKGVSIVLCTYNGKNRLEETFKHLAAQKITVPCEIIFVDNASTDGTKEFADHWWQLNESSLISYRSFVQPIPGKSYAQDLGYDQAQYEYILVCDDDNWLCDIYVQTAYAIMTENASIGALGGWCDGVFESKKPEWFDKYTKYYVVVKQGKRSGDITHKKGCLYGAGMVLRKSHWLQLKALGFNHLLSCRKGDSLSSGGDTEYCYALRLLGYKIWYDERLYFKHFMTKGRLYKAYVSELRKELSYSNFILWPYRDVLSGKPKTKYSLYRSVLTGMPSILIKNVINLKFGDFDKKEAAKDYFRYFKYKVFYASIYLENLKSVRSWAQTTNKNNFD
ncbi:glycosyltransferase [Psychroserpens burtonensis]|uniref:glycosyltransferase n=1 Tax=Psychroserpens burtonensis TaxID=49278 RepID=UPI0003F6EE77|nr:glycosyltransferase [Psychroserpens burtonensis]